MNLLFNKDGDGVEELRRYLSGLWASTEFDTIKGYLESASLQIIQDLGPEIYAKAATHYESNAYDADGEDDLDSLVNQMANVVAKSAYLEMAPVADLKHDGNGRRMHVDESSKAPWEWMVTAADRSVFNQVYQGMNRLIQFLDGQSWTEWKQSAPYLRRAGLFCRQVQDIDPIGQSYWFFQKTLVFSEEYQEQHVEPVMGEALAIAILDKIKDGASLSSLETKLYKVAKRIIRHGVLARACREMPLEFLPSGVVQRYDSDRANKQASIPASLELLDRSALYHDEEARKDQKRLQALMRTQLNDEEGPRQHNDQEIFFRP